MNQREALGFTWQGRGDGVETCKHLLEKDWSMSPLGELKDWPQSLRFAVNLSLNSNLPIAVWWSDDLLIICNGAFRSFMHLKHPDDQGKKGADVLPDIWNDLEPSILEAFKKGVPTELQNYVINAHGGGTEGNCVTFYNSPIPGENGNVGGVFTSLVVSRAPNLEEKSRQKIKEDEERLEMKLKENELKMELTLQASEMGSFDWNIVTSEFEYSDRLTEIFGYSEPGRLVQKDFIERIHPDDHQIRRKAHEVAFETSNLFYEARVIWPNSSIRWVRVNGHVIFDKLGKPERMYGTILDITDSRTKEDALEQKVRERTVLIEKTIDELKKSEERYTKMTEEVQDYAIILLDRGGTILNWNRGAQNIKGYTDTEIIGKNFSVFYLDEDRKSKLPEKLIQKAVDEGRAMHEGLRKRKDGTTFWGSIVITALHNDDNNVIGFTKVTRDLTERKMAEDRMREHASELEIKNRQLEQFAYIASHDLQEPLRKIQTFIEVLEKKKDNEDVRNRYFAKINKSAKRMGQLIQSVLNYSRLSQTKELMVSTDLNILLENVLTDYELLIEEKNAVVQYDRMPVVHGIELQLGQLFSNLIGNSLKFSEAQPVISIFCRTVNSNQLKELLPVTDPSGNYLELTFKDNGIGFEQQYAEKIFNIFQRLNSREDYAGTGIGLALCKRIVENHNGYIYAKSELGHGAEFYVYLPSK